MPVKLKYGSNVRNKLKASGLESHILRVALIALLAILVVGCSVFGYFYYHYQRVVDDRIASGPIFASVSQIYAAPREVRAGQKLSAAAIAADLRQAGYNANSQLGTYQLNADNIFIKPGPESYHNTDGATINTTGGIVQSITAENGVSLSAYELEPQLITALSEDKNRTKRRLVSYNEIPPRMVQAVIAIEDRDFFNHGGINYLRIAKCAFSDLVTHHRTCGGSTLTQQLAKNLFLSPEKRIKRKMIEILITFQLEARFTKKQIFEMYANEINLGQRGSYAINGFGEAAQTFFGKNLQQLDLAECALLAGTIQSPTRLNPYRHPERAMERRNVVLESMVETGAITASQAQTAKAEPLRLAPPNIDASEAPYFVDLVHDQLVKHIGDQDIAHQSLRIYTSLDPELQRAASEAVEIGMKNVDELVRKQHKTPKGEQPGPITYPQVALVAINPHTGQILALVGGRNYGASQLNHAVSQRPTGSIFKPFVYAAAYNSSLNGLSLSNGDTGGSGVFTALTELNDEETTFTYDNGRQTYTPKNLISGYKGDVTAAYALAHSLNAATVQLGQMVGFDNVAALARSAGITNARGTPSVAIGTYNATPIDMAGAYTVFANNGVHLTPWMLASVRNASGDIVSDFSPDAKQVMDPRAAYLTQSLLEGVMNYGTAAAVRGHGFTAPAAGKTGTSHDAWFAGYTSNLICIVWVGNDDYTDVKIEGAHAAEPIWTEFMKRAILLPQYSDVKPFVAPAGITTARIDKTSNLIADSTCPGNILYAAFLDGTAPINTCSQMSESPQNLIQRILGIGGSKSETTTPPPTTGAPIVRVPPNTPPDGNAPDTTQQPTPPKKKNFFQKIFGGGKDKDKDKQQEQPAPPPQ
ncbi:transglycosylase domain-containing protein [Tunturibacter empetritectus]|uniref:Penicillin-binding protein 1B n=3 Tax=Tunturiibacter empetritectus TaxID=3069691 RepID=A0A7W8MQ36_9BACT|nr:PBP1A family penicillin-binding protein [Edaphobacter lichenicola]MBB5316123.1 penicillin-binding protein 1B [Edaphobacter lichenicola]